MAIIWFILNNGVKISKKYITFHGQVVDGRRDQAVLERTMGEWLGWAETCAAGLKQIVQQTFGGSSTISNSYYKCTFENKYTFNELILTFRNTTDL